MSYTRSNFKDLTAPGYFDYSAQQTEKSKQFNNWFNGITKIIQDNINLMDSIFRLWATRDYSQSTIPITPWIRYLLIQNGIGWYSQNLEIARKLIIYVSKSFPKSAVKCFQEYFDFLLDIGWITQFGQIFFNPATPARFSETFLIYSDSVGLPATPDPSEYVPLDWDAPNDWSLTAASSTYYSRGYIDDGDIIWMTPQPTNLVYLMQDYETLGELPVSADIGQLAGVFDDGTGDVGSVYYWDGTTWRKTTGINSNQGLVTGQVPPVPGSSVYDPIGISSGIKPPDDGPSQGFGYYGIYGQLLLTSKRIDIFINLTENGFDNLGIIIFLFRKIKPTLNSLVIHYNTPSNSEYIQLEITDSGATE